MDGTFSALLEITQMIEETFALGNADLVVDEAHSAGFMVPGTGVRCTFGIGRQGPRETCGIRKGIGYDWCRGTGKRLNTRLPPQLRSSTHLHYLAQPV
ncbi:hypothetical protein BKA70DRAFT_1436278 [Coprinopsis sp. MPI-PUGE-AT-0042]|nr:hypothetical protein BKA70DRAFT_1436278 [Coprinopsis sp. MPI-PUGE-AT-0042]